MAAPDMDVIKEVPGYRVILKAVLKAQIRQLVEQLATQTEEESIILTASVTDGTLSHLGSDSAVGFLEDHEDVKSQFLGYCLKSHHKRKQEQEQKEREEVIRKAEAEALQQQQAFQQSMGYMSPRATMPRMVQRSPRQQFRPPGGGVRHQPYPVTRPIRASATAIRSSAKVDGQVIKSEPDNDASNQSAGDNLGSSQPASPSQTSAQAGADDSESSSSTIPNEPGQEGLSLGADLSGLVSGDGMEQSGDGEQDVSVKLERLTESEMDELEITGVEPGRPMPSAQDWNATMSGMGFDPSASGATGSPGDLAAQQGYNSHWIHTSDGEVLHVQKVSTNKGNSLQCNVCRKVFRDTWRLRNHYRLHTGEKPYRCNVCQKSFREKSHCTKHLKIHKMQNDKQQTVDVKSETTAPEMVKIENLTDKKDESIMHDTQSNEPMIEVKKETLIDFYEDI
ncbi:zinc finger protein with KRAB and SCAN domains 5-like isoform X4 [Mya arenaria]|uniref:zinc finger protein with KRAB and SCAN domains 5-like isoform X4 n=1 Tax=Mya arenaria TaxID=6604 RepID=UPI0022E65763|nr:zinc finger protein with KRAB and SCAN domains 5-like isoform X4 [Mya arenaria]